MLKNYRNLFTAGVLAFGLAACGDDVTIVDPAPPPPPPETPNIVSFSVAPTNATIAAGTTLQASYNLQTKAGVAGTVAWASSNPAVATVDAATGLISAVTNGTAVIEATATAGGQTAKAQVGLTVRPIQAAQISIQSVTTGMTNTPVPLNNVTGQIEVNMNFNPGEQLVDSVNVFIGAKRAAKQAFATSPAAGIISLSINTANFVKNSTTGVAAVDYQNGASTISAAVYPRGGAATATNTIAVVLNNMDGWAADMSKPTRFANQIANGLTYWGGPDAAGQTTVTVYPVIYTPGRSIASVTFRAGGCPNKTDTSLPFRDVFGYTPAPTNCGGAAGYEWNGGSLDNVTVASAIDNTNNPFPTTPLIANIVVPGSTPDSLRFDWRSPAVTTPSITRTAPAVTGWVNGSFSFVVNSTDNGVGIPATANRDRKTFYNANTTSGGVTTNRCTGVANDNPMPTRTGADIPECASNFIGGTPGLGSPGTAPYQVYATEPDLLANLGTSGLTQTFGVDKTAPSIRWGTEDLAFPLVISLNTTDSTGSADSTFYTKPIPGTDVWRAEYLDDRAGFLNNTSGANSQITSQIHALSTAGHVNNAGLCVVAFTGAGSVGVGTAFVTAPTCSMVNVGSLSGLRNDGWFAGTQVDVPQMEGYYGYRTQVRDAAGNASATLGHRSLVNAVSPFATGLTVPGSLTASTFAFGPTFADSAEVIRQSLQVTYPEALTLAGSLSDSLRYTQTAIGTAFDDVITSPYLASIAPNTGAPYVRHLEAVTAAVFPGNNVQAAPANTKPVNVVAWSWNPGSLFAGGPLPGRSSIIAIPALLVQDGVTFNTFNTGNTTNSVTHFRIIATVANSNQFGSTAPLRAQAVSPTNTPNAPFARVDFYRQVTVGPDSWWSYLGSSTTAIGSDQGAFRSWVWAAPSTFVRAWDGSAQGAPAGGDVMMAVGVTAAGDGLATAVTMTP